MMGRNVRRKDASALICFTVKDIFEELNDSVQEAREAHSTAGFGNCLFLQVGGPRGVRPSPRVGC